MPWQACSGLRFPRNSASDGVPRASGERGRRSPVEFPTDDADLEPHPHLCRRRRLPGQRRDLPRRRAPWPAGQRGRRQFHSGAAGSADRAHSCRLRDGCRRRLDCGTRGKGRYRHYLRYPAGEPLREGRRRGDRTERQAVYGTIDRNDAGGPQSDDRFTVIGRGDRRPQIVRTARPLGVPVGTRSNHPPHPAPARRAICTKTKLKSNTMAPPLIQLKDIALTFGGTPLLSGVELSVSAAERVCLIGRNGSGKSTLLKIAAGLVEPDHGSCFVQPGATVRYLPQEPDFSGHATTLAYVEAGLGPADDHSQARYLLEQLGLHGDEAPAHLSGGEARRTALARVLAPSPDILLLDEPTNHLDLTTIEWLESELDSRRSALVIISHDRRFMSNLSRSTAWLDRGQIRQIDRGFSAFEAWRDEVLAEEEPDQHKLDRKIVNEEHWLRYGVSGRRKRNVKRLGNLYALRDQRRNYRGATGDANLAAAEADKSGKLVIEAKTIGRSYGDRKIVDGFSIRVQRGDRIGIVGAQGGGKTTLIDMLTGAKPPDTGTIRFGANIEMATLDQHRESLDPKSTLAEALTGGRGDHVMVGGKPKH